MTRVSWGSLGGEEKMGNLMMAYEGEGWSYDPALNVTVQTNVRCDLEPCFFYVSALLWNVGYCFLDL